ncbi:hypothetical protein RD792_013476 [Penstemon davidsonii]|uniref:HhH-GPD domain-containing protein n=1 Tax=Penstemon davidsonii TaxID=160366 RepID=A0ABR0CUH3_9LAMI|nr:hypothetical protein RD792_013476 [Penstemon davidsonii]
MNLGRGFSFSQDKEILQNGHIWIPATPEKPVVQRPNYPPAATPENPVMQRPNYPPAATPEKPVVQRPNHPQADTTENWQDLLGMYTGLLQDEACNVPSQKYNPNTSDMALVSTYNSLPRNLNRTGLVQRNREEQSIRNFAQFETYNRLPQNFDSNGLIGMNLREQNTRDVSIEKFRSLNQNTGSIGSYMQNLDNVVPRKVSSLAELMGMKSALNAPLTNGEPNRSAFGVQKPINIIPQSQAESNSMTYKSASAMIQPNHNLQDNYGLGGFNLQQMPKGRLSVPYRPNYNLNLPPISEAGESSSSAAGPFQLGPITPDQQQKSKNYQIIQVPQLCIEGIPHQDRDTQGSGVLSQQTEIVEKEPKQKEKDNFDGGNERGIDLNITPPQKTPKRRKHRPKVVVEGKSKKTPKVSIKENNTPDGKSTGKRKYVRRKGIETSKSNTPNVENVAAASQIESAVKSCRRALNFELENGTEKDSQGRKVDCQAQNNVGNEAAASHIESAVKSCRGSLNFVLENSKEKDSQGRKFDCQAQNNEVSKVPFNLNLDSHNTEINEPSTSAVKEGHNNISGKEKHRTENLPPAPKNHTLNVIARSLNVRSANINQSGAQNRYDQIQHHFGGGLAQVVIQANTNWPNLDRTRQLMLHSKPQPVENLVNTAEKRGSKREYSNTELPQAQNVSVMGSLCFNGVSETGHNNSYSSNVWQKESESVKRNKIEDKFNVTSSSMTSEIINVEDSPGPIERRRNKSFNAQSSTLCMNGALPNSDIKGKCTSSNLHYQANNVTFDWSTNLRLKFQHQIQHQIASSQVHQNTKSLATITDLNQEPVCERDPKFTQGNDILSSPVRVPVKRQTAGQVPSNKVSRMDKVPQQETKNARGYKHSPKDVTGLREENRVFFSVDYITDRMNNLRLSNNGKEIVREEQSALVPYKGDGAIVAYEAFDPIKKRRPRPKVDLDPETNRLWNLLMGKEGSESADKVDIDKEKWWEEERKVFRGRVDSFIARMHLVQGDRRFSKWKGSVVDSVIGVFLTQNVSDHLSSSAFMSLAAKFPPKSTTIRQHEVQVTYPDEATYDHRTTRETVSIHSSVTSIESSEFKTGNAMKGTVSNLMNDHTKRTEEDIISSQSSSESFIFQASEDIRSSSGSTSEAEDHIIGCNLNKNQQPERIAAFNQHHFQVMGSLSLDNRPFIGHQPLETPVYGQYPGLATGRDVYSYPFNSNVPNSQSPVRLSTSSWLNMSTGLEKWEEDALASLGNESISSLASIIDFGYTSETRAENGHDNAGQGAESNFAAQQAGKPILQPSMAHHETLNKYPVQQTDSPSLSKQPSGNVQKYSHVSIFTKPYFDNELNIVVDTRERSENVTVEPNEMGHVHSSTGPSNKIGATTLNRKRKAEKEKVEPFNWDTLRKQVQEKHGTRGISRDAMDSLDYEALRNADVRVISDAIKERGMNNMLAERMKDFLNRLVRDHGRTDLEWLRDVQPDKAKDYLLSIRGLGLKSVECVRLLTLHHLAFPVDTNVGRIAVRLGWVPLQPLPESLQLHLLEMVSRKLVSIYLMQVFCTKREPNCNACPLRAECRHFASAFASARLALPGPEEKRVVSSSAPPNAKRSPDVIIKPVPLLLAEDNLERQTGLTRNCEPIIEEPTTPEATIEVTEREIEDAFYEDPDEIPVIKLNIEEFTTNLQSFMQEHMEMQEGDMSRALVALSPELASIPKPKLKHISRLRTEHQVYELPDTHPLLKGLDRREPDDPSPYLLAIWTPGK